ncbi:hypothetical protein BpHYR1_037802 [Brachionus plicatilis]|uniref:Uncharacterized protein n=1 Tax=Brachionus plicatilis TaxID=10195 RepID=A0A3M7QNA7_BRAPC|nr:hypothetical protein BpHYR1_037802 [Brachionus plicatilis]
MDFELQPFYNETIMFHAKDDYRLFVLIARMVKAALSFSILITTYFVAPFLPEKIFLVSKRVTTKINLNGG